MLAQARDFYRFPDLVFISLFVPLILELVLVLALRDQTPEPLKVVIESSSGMEREVARLEAVLAKDETLRVWSAAAPEAELQMNANKALLTLVPGSPPTYRFDPTRVESRLTRERVDAALQRGAGRQDTISARTELRTEPGTRYIDFFFPGLFGVAVMNNALNGLGFMAVDMRMKKILKRLRGSPMRPAEYLLSIVLFRKIHLIPETVIMVAGAHFLCSVPVRGSLWLLALMFFLGSLAFSGLGLMATARTRNTHAASGWLNLITIPMLVGSGVFFSSERFPWFLQPLLKALPLTALLDGLRAVMLDGAGLEQLKMPIFVLVVWSVVCFVGTARWFSWD